MWRLRERNPEIPPLPRTVSRHAMNEVLSVDTEPTKSGSDLSSHNARLVCPACGGHTFVGLKTASGSGNDVALVCAQHKCGHVIRPQHTLSDGQSIDGEGRTLKSPAARLRGDDIDALIGRRVREARIEQEFTQKNLAQLMGVSREAISAIETGRERVPAFRIVAISTALRLPVSYFFGEGHPSA